MYASNQGSKYLDKKGAFNLNLTYIRSKSKTFLGLVLV